MLAACQPLPHPFAYQKVPIGSPLLPLGDSAGVAVDPIEGDPKSLASQLAPAVAEALRKLDIPASDKSTSLASYELYGQLREIAAPAPPEGAPAAKNAEKPPQKEGKASRKAGKPARQIASASTRDGKTLIVVWHLRDPNGHFLGGTTERIAMPDSDRAGGGDRLVAELAASTATHLAPMLRPAAPREARIADHPIRLRLGGVTGAPGDGDKALGAAIEALLAAQHGMLVSDDKHPADLVLTTRVTVAKPKDSGQHVTIVWHVRRPNGGEIGQVSQANDVPAGRLDHAWGEIAAAIAASAQGGIVALIEHARVAGLPGETAETR